jgi:hypothetical protein
MKKYNYNNNNILEGYATYEMYVFPTKKEEI